FGGVRAGGRAALSAPSACPPSPRPAARPPRARTRRRRTPPRADRSQFTPRNAPCPPIDARLSHRIHRIAIASTHDDNTESCYAAVSRSPESAALGRSSLLSSQPGQPIASFGERDQLSVRLCDDVSG